MAREILHYVQIDIPGEFSSNDYARFFIAFRMTCQDGICYCERANLSFSVILNELLGEEESQLRVRWMSKTTWLKYYNYDSSN